VRPWIVFALLSIWTGCGRSSIDNRGIPVQLVTTAGATGHLPAELAESLGYYRQEGLDVTIHRMSSSAKVMEALIGGSADVACAGQQHLIQLAAEGKFVRAFVAEFNNPGYSLVVSPVESRKIDKVEDLKGQLVGVSAPGGGHHTFLNYVLSKHGMAPEDVRAVSIGVGAPSLAALERGTVTAAVADLATVSLLKTRHPTLILLADTSTREGMRRIFGGETSYQYTLCAKTEWLDRNRGTARRMSAAIIRTLRWMHEHSPEQVGEKLPDASRTLDAESDIRALRIAIPFFSIDGVISPEAVRVAQDAAAASSAKVRAADIDLSKTYTNEWVRER
jgi:NitT/TauT family transport system substrate-binding protein